jgi:hypothetical protein
VPTPTPQPTATPAQPFNPVCRAFPTDGNEPLLVTFDCCASTGTNLRFEWDFESDGVEDQRGVCRTQRVYRLAGVSNTLATTEFTKTYDPEVIVREATADPNRVVVQFIISVTGILPLKIQPARETVAGRRVSWLADLETADSAQIVVNGSAAVYARRGRSTGAAAGRQGLNQIEVQIVQGRGAGRLSIDLRSMPSLVPGSLRVVAGDVVAVTDTAITFQLRGKSGERVVFTLEAGQ